jgi:hypothetical protein
MEHHVPGIPCSAIMRPHGQVQDAAQVKTEQRGEGTASAHIAQTARQVKRTKKQRDRRRTDGTAKKEKRKRSKKIKREHIEAA